MKEIHNISFNNIYSYLYFFIFFNLIIEINGEKLINQYNKACLPPGYSVFYLDYDFDIDHISVLNASIFIITGTDLYGNKLSEPLSNDVTLELIKDGVPVDESEYEANKNEINSGDLYYEIKIHKIGNYQLRMLYKGKEIKDVNSGLPLPSLTLEAGPCYAENNSNIDLSTIEQIFSVNPIIFKFQCYDKYNNKITKGGENFTVHGNSIMNNGTINIINCKIEDNNDGSYTVSFIPDNPAEYNIKLYNNGEKYGQDILLNLTKIAKICSGSTPILCDNNECVEHIYFCNISLIGCNKEKPFKCKVNNEEICVKSRTDCDCPENYVKCDFIINYCVPKDRIGACAEILIHRKCQILYSEWTKMFDDGICRLPEGRLPNQRVCPLGKILCWDLSCQDNYNLCPVNLEIPLRYMKCLDQTIVRKAIDCPSTTTCSNPDYVVCPDGKCVENEIYCNQLTECSSNQYLCNNNKCAESYDNCEKQKACGDGFSLCEDGECKELC